MKTVFDNKMVAHVWAQQTQDTGTSHNRNFHFSGQFLYSYRTPIARALKNRKGDILYLVTPEKYSMTTSCKHMPAIYRAIQEDKTVYTPFLTSRVSHALGKPEYAATLDYMQAQYKKAIETNKNYKIHCSSWGYRQGDYNFTSPWGIIPALDDALKLHYDKMILFCKFLGIKPRAMPYIKDAQLITEYRRQKEIEYLDPKKVAKRKRAAEKRQYDALYKAALEENEERETQANQISEAKINLQEFLDDKIDGIYWYLERWVNTDTPEYRAACIRAENRKQEKLKAELASWIAGDPEAKVLYQLVPPYALMRINPKNPEEIETTQGAKFPVAHAKKAWPKIQACKDSGILWEKNGHTIPVGHFQIDAIWPWDSCGQLVVKAGCHKLQYSELLRMAKLLGIA